MKDIGARDVDGGADDVVPLLDILVVVFVPVPASGSGMLRVLEADNKGRFADIRTTGICNPTLLIPVWYSSSGCQEH